MDHSDIHHSHRQCHRCRSLLGPGCRSQGSCPIRRPRRCQNHSIRVGTHTCRTSRQCRDWSRRNHNQRHNYCSSRQTRSFRCHNTACLHCSCTSILIRSNRTYRGYMSYRRRYNRSLMGSYYSPLHPHRRNFHSTFHTNHNLQGSWSNSRSGRIFRSRNPMLCSSCRSHLLPYRSRHRMLRRYRHSHRRSRLW